VALLVVEAAAEEEEEEAEAPRTSYAFRAIKWDICPQTVLRRRTPESERERREDSDMKFYLKF
jgi:hypothetical protein